MSRRGALHSETMAGTNMHASRLAVLFFVGTLMVWYFVACLGSAEKNL